MLTVPAPAATAGLCAFQESVTINGTVTTSTFHVVRDDCQVSFVSISKFALGNAIFDTATGVFAASETRYQLSVSMPCGYDSETDLVLGPPALYPPGDLDLRARSFHVECPAGGGGGSSSGGGSGGGGSGGGGSGGGGSGGGGTQGAAAPDLTSVLSSSKTNGVRVGTPSPSRSRSRTRVKPQLAACTP